MVKHFLKFQIKLMAYVSFHMWQSDVDQIKSNEAKEMGVIELSASA